MRVASACARDAGCCGVQGVADMTCCAMEAAQNVTVNHQCAAKAGSDANHQAAFVAFRDAPASFAQSVGVYVAKRGDGDTELLL